MIKISKKNNNSRTSLYDLNNNILKDGDTVISFRYDLGKCKVILGETGIIYESIENGQQVHWTKMIDAITGRQKVRKED